MVSNKPNIQIPMPSREGHLDRHRPYIASHRTPSPRSPRFHEDFDAPFSEAYINASRTTLSTEFSDNFLSSQLGSSNDVGDKTHVATTHQTQASHQALPPQWQDGTCPADANPGLRRNRRIRDWVKKSLLLARNDSEVTNDTDLNGDRLQTSRHFEVNPRPVEAPSNDAVSVE